MTDVATLSAAFGARLHAAGLPTTPERSGRFVEIIDLTEPRTIASLYWAGRLAFVIDRASIEVFDRVFGEVFRGHVDVADVDRNPNAPADTPHVTRGEQRGERGGPVTAGDSPADRPTIPGSSSDESDDDADSLGELAMVAEHELLRDKPFDTCTSDELIELGRLITRLGVEPPIRVSRRTRRDRHRGDVDWRATLRAAHRQGGDPVRLVHRARRQRRRRVVLIADVSGSMESYSRAYLYLLHGAVRALGAEAFVFATRLTRLTRHLADHDPQLALVRARAAAPDWAGGTRIGDALRSFNDGWGRRGLARGAVVVIVSDGWESGSPALLGREVERLSRLAHRIVWVNPRRQSPRFEPRTGGMAAALPYVDVFVSGHSLAELHHVAAAIAAD